MSRSSLKLFWRRRALADLAQIVERSPAQAQRVMSSMEWMSSTGWSLGHPVSFEGRTARYWPVPPHGVYYRVRGEVLHILRIRDALRLRQPPS